MSLLCAIFFARADEASYVRNSGVYCSEAAFVELVFFLFLFFFFMFMQVNGVALPVDGGLAASHPVVPGKFF